MITSPRDRIVFNAKNANIKLLCFLGYSRNYGRELEAILPLGSINNIPVQIAFKTVSVEFFPSFSINFLNFQFPSYQARKICLSISSHIATQRVYPHFTPQWCFLPTLESDTIFGKLTKEEELRAFWVRFNTRGINSPLKNQGEKTKKKNTTNQINRQRKKILILKYSL